MAKLYFTDWTKNVGMPFKSHSKSSIVVLRSVEAIWCTDAKKKTLVYSPLRSQIVQNVTNSLYCRNKTCTYGFIQHEWFYRGTKSSAKSESRIYACHRNWMSVINLHGGDFIATLVPTAAAAAKPFCGGLSLQPWSPRKQSPITTWRLCSSR